MIVNNIISFVYFTDEKQKLEDLKKDEEKNTGMRNQETEEVNLEVGEETLQEVDMILQDMMKEEIDMIEEILGSCEEMMIDVGEEVDL